MSDATATVAAPAPAAPARAMRERKPGPPLLESGRPDPPGKGKPVRKAGGGGSKKGRTAKTRGGASAAAKGGSRSKNAAKSGDVVSHGAAVNADAGNLPMLQLAENDDYTTGGHAQIAEEDEDDGALFCVCLGKDDGTPMILCESCENWFHFPCIHLDMEEAKNIAAFFCNVCEQAGSGKTQWNPQATSVPSQSDATSNSMPSQALPPLPPLPVIQTPSDSGNDTDGDYFARKDAKYGGHSTDDDYAEGEGPSSANKRKRVEQPQRRKSGSMGNQASTNAGKRRKGVIEDEDDREERRKHAKKASLDQSRFYANQAGGSGKEQPAENNKTRKHAIDQLELSFKTIFSSSPVATPDPSSSGVPAPESASTSPDKAKSFASSVEADLFLNYHEIDEKDKRTKIPGRKYISKFRTLNFNLKGNEYFRSRIAASLLDEKAIVNMAQDDLLTPEARAEQEALKNKSLAQSVKVTVAQPKVKMTHKGEEVIDEFDSAMMKDAANKISNEQHMIKEDNDTSFMSDMRERSRSMSLAAGSPGGEQSPRFGSPVAGTFMSPITGQSPFQRSFSPVVEMGPTALRQSTSGLAASPGKESDGGENDAAARRPSLSHHARSDSMSKSKLDLDSIWGAYKAPAETPEAETEEGKDGVKTNTDEVKQEAEEGGDAGKAEEFDPFSFSQEEKRNTDEDFDAIMNLDAIDDSNEEAKPNAKQEEAEADKTSALPTVWEGKVVHPDEGDFAARIVQVGGTSLGAHPHIWNQILPKGQIELSGRIDIKPAAEYLVQAKFAPKREVIVLALLPAQPAAGEGSLEKAQEGQMKLTSYFHDKKRYGVAPPGDELKAVTKDHYIVPLKKEDPLPDYIELLDDFILGETGTRDKDYLLSVLVLSKGAWLGSGGLPSTAKVAGGSTPLPQGSSPKRDPRQQVSAQPPKAPTPLGPSQPTPVPSYASPLNQHGGQTNTLTMQGQPFNQQQQQLLQQAANPNLPALDPNALQSLLSNPSLLQALNGGPAQTNNFANPVPSLQPNMPFHPSQQSQYQANIPQNTPPWAGGQPQPWQHGQPPANQWNSAGSPPWQGGQSTIPNMQGGWAGSNNNAPGSSQQFQGGPGFIHPDRIKQASMEAAEIAAREQRDRDRRGGSGGYGRRDSDDRSRDRDRGGRDDRNYGRSGDRDRENRRPRNSDYRSTRNDSGGNRDRDTNRGGGRSSGSGSGNNQMNAGISDRGWGNRR